MQPINLSPSFLSKIYDKGYDYAVGEKLGLFPKVTTESMTDGRLIHSLIAQKLGGDECKFAVSPFDNFRTKEARLWRDSQPDDVPIVTEDKIEGYNNIVQRILTHTQIKDFFTFPCLTEQIIEKKINGHNVKGIIDLLSTYEDSRTIVDWKFVSSQIFDSFAKKALYMHYDLQACVYDYLVEPTNVYFCVIENEAPHRIKLFHCDSSFLDSGAIKFDKAFKILKEANWREPNFNIDEVGELMSWENHNG